MGAEVKSMDIKKLQTASIGDKPLKKARVQDFVADIKSEILKINWTSREELIVYTQIVVVSTFVLGIGIYATDLFIQGFLHSVSYLFSFISG